MNGQDTIDIFENDIPVEILSVLLRDNSYQGEVKNIFWATNDYQSLGNGYQYNDTIELDKIQSGKIIIPRVLKSKMQQVARVREMAEVFTPSWICNTQNNLIDNAWFGRENVFNFEEEDYSWTVNIEKITFPAGKTWLDYVRDNRLEITCGEAPYLVSRYDTTTGEAIPVERRIGMLDRKLRIISENAKSGKEWLEIAKDALKATYGYEWQGDSLLLAREAALYTVIEHWQEWCSKNTEGQAEKLPPKEILLEFAEIISWNLWQMDGMKGVVPDSCHDIEEDSLFGEPSKKPCPGCQQEDIKYHNGVYCLIKDWKVKDPKTGKLGKIIRYVDMIK